MFWTLTPATAVVEILHDLMYIYTYREDYITRIRIFFNEVYIRSCRVCIINRMKPAQELLCNADSGRNAPLGKD